MKSVHRRRNRQACGIQWPGIRLKLLRRWLRSWNLSGRNGWRCVRRRGEASDGACVPQNKASAQMTVLSVGVFWMVASLIFVVIVRTVFSHEDGALADVYVSALLPQKAYVDTDPHPASHLTQVVGMAGLMGLLLMSTVADLDIDKIMCKRNWKVAGLTADACTETLLVAVFAASVSPRVTLAGLDSLLHGLWGLLLRNVGGNGY